ncbi:hypothetical protein ACWD4G_23830 [Streptomyces sp. NPDC002643]
MARQRRREARDAGQEILGRVAKAGDSGLPREEAIGRLTLAEFERGKAWLRDHLPPSTKKIVRQNGRYTVTSAEDEEGE